jgi:hypothetical protein
MHSICCAGGLENVQQNCTQGEPSPRHLPNGDLVPDITIQFCNADSVLWSSNLGEVSDDLASQYLAAQGSSFTFTLEVRGKGPVEGILWCAPTLHGVTSLCAHVWAPCSEQENSRIMAMQVFSIQK